MKRKYAYVFAVGMKVVWSSETEDSLRKRVRDKTDIDEVNRLIWRNKRGDFCSLNTGEMVFQIED